MKIVLDAHCHTVASGHAYSTVYENARAAAQRGLSLLAITDHAPAMPGSCGEFHFANFVALPSSIEGVEILSGVELNILDESGRVDLSDYTLSRLAVVIASLHPPCLPPSDMASNASALIGAIKNPYVKIVGHPGDPRYPVDMEAVTDAARDYGVAMEINNASFNPMGLRKGSEEETERIIALCLKKGVPLVASSDAHYMDSVGALDDSLRIIKKAGVPDNLVLNTSVELFKNFIYNKQ